MTILYYSLQFLAEGVREPRVEGEVVWQVSLKEWDPSSLLKSLTFTILYLKKQNKTHPDTVYPISRHEMTKNWK